MMHIDEVVNAVWAKISKIARETYRSDEDINIVVYMDYEFYVLCKSDIKGEVSQAAYEFSHKDTVIGYPVHKVTHTIRVEGEHKHPPFRVVNLDG